jgi:hypothetical protein
MRGRPAPCAGIEMRGDLRRLDEAIDIRRKLFFDLVTVHQKTFDWR